MTKPKPKPSPVGADPDGNPTPSALSGLLLAPEDVDLSKPGLADALKDFGEPVTVNRSTGKVTKAPKAPKDTPPTASPSKAGRPSAKSKRVEALSSLFGMVGLGVCALPFTEAANDGLVVIAGAPSLAEALATAAETNSGLAKLIDSMIKTSAYGAIGAAVLGIAIPIMANHGMLPTEAVLMFPPAATVAGEVATLTAAMATQTPHETWING